ncbi:hypothetical protein I316_03440 [Kwoniella heveanensis BCC8398]|uniref:Uncharacterized protein n=1 Tax=Kwoniella heveanensis BCC8398 TaxID=1296120 RepID=A0A1B9GV28_9TREE|nr:hypothetical protein I316_03440 [Kwoniella heveanensis BCC8398]
MSEDLHPDLEEFYDAIGGSDEDQWEDEPEDDGVIHEDAGYEVYFDSGMMMDEDDDEDYDDEEYIDEDDIEEEYYAEDGDSDEDLGNAILLDEADQGRTGAGGVNDDDDEDDGSGRAFLDLAAIINNASGGDVQARSALLARLFGSSAPRTRSGAAPVDEILRRLAGGNGRGVEISEEERAKKRLEDRKKWWKPQTEPDPRGVELLRSGEFGRVGDWRIRSTEKGPTTRPRPRYSERRLGGWTGPAARPQPSRGTIPNTPGTVVARYSAVPYVGQFAKEDYSIFYTATQNFTLHMYAMNQSQKSSSAHRRRRATSRQPVPLSPQGGAIDEDVEDRESDYEDEDEDEDEDDAMWMGWGNGRRGFPSEESSLKSIKTVQGVDGSWTVTDCDVDKRGERMIYSSITPYVHMIYTNEFDQEHTELDFSSSGGRRDPFGYERVGIWSIRFSADGHEVVAGANGGKIMVYDIDAQRRTLSVTGHNDDVNAVCFADESSTNILVSGSDDGYVKIWDRRSLSSSTPSGVLVGATEGITYTAPKGDGRYIVVNSKDQAARLYDLRKMRSWSEFEDEGDAVSCWGQDHFDFVQVLNRAESVPLRQRSGSSSAAGARVGAFSDPSAPIHINERTQGNPPWHVPRPREDYSSQHTVRDVSWHGYEPTLMSTSWGSDRSYGTIAKHEWKGLGKGGLDKLEDWVEKKRAESGGDAGATGIDALGVW